MSNIKMSEIPELLEMSGLQLLQRILPLLRQPVEEQPDEADFERVFLSPKFDKEGEIVDITTIDDPSDIISKSMVHFYVMIDGKKVHVGSFCILPLEETILQDGCLMLSPKGKAILLDLREKYFALFGDEVDVDSDDQEEKEDFTSWLIDQYVPYFTDYGDEDEMCWDWYTVVKSLCTAFSAYSALMSTNSVYHPKQ